MNKELILREQKEFLIQEIQKTIRELKEQYFKIIVPIKVAYLQLTKYTIPEINSLPETLNSQAKEWKEKYIASKDQSMVIESYKNNALKALKQKLAIEHNISKLETIKEKLEYIIKTNEAEFKSKIFELEISKAELETYINIPESNFINTMDNVNEIKMNLTQTLQKMELGKEINKIMQKENNINTNESYEKAKRLFENL